MRGFSGVQGLRAAAGVAAAGVLLAGGVWHASAMRAAVVPEPADSQWIRAVPGPVLAVFHQSGGTLYAGTGRGLYRSDEGRRWERVFSAGLWARPVNVIGMGRPGEKRFWVAAGSRMHLSGDSGRSWRPSQSYPGTILCVASSPQDPARFLVGTTEGLFLSRNGGTSGGPVPGTPARVSFYSVLFDPEHPARCFTLSDRGLYRSDDGGEGWSKETGLLLQRASAGRQEDTETEEPAPDEDLPPTGREFPQPQLAADLSRGMLFVSTGKGIFQSRDGGREWSPLPSEGLPEEGATAERLLLKPGLPGRLLALKGSQIYAYQPDRQLWQRAASLPEGRVHDLQWEEGGNALWAGTAAGLFRVPLQQEIAAAPRPQEGPASGAEPSIQQVQRMAIAYGEVGPEKIRRWRGLARLRGFIPSFTLGLDQDRDANIVSSTTAGVTRFAVGPDRRTRSLDFGLTWDLGDFVWSPDQTSIDVRSRLTTQLRQDLLEEATRLYFERKRLLAEFEAQPTGDAALKRERALRIAELNAYLDALTGGWFSRQLD